MNSTDAAYRRDNFILTFMDCLCVPDQKDYTQQDICDCNEAITEYECMLQHAIDVGDKQKLLFYDQKYSTLRLKNVISRE